jgi:RNA polymerase-interacting CarD/CdnL/TRCF family regulator
MSDSNAPTNELVNGETIKGEEIQNKELSEEIPQAIPQEQKGGKVKTMKNKKANKKTMKNKKSNKKTMKKSANGLMKWTDFAVKLFRDNRKKNPNYQYKQALQDASKILKKNKK